MKKNVILKIIRMQNFAEVIKKAGFIMKKMNKINSIVGGKLPKLKKELRIKSLNKNMGFSEMIKEINYWNEWFNQKCYMIERKANSGKLKY